MLKIKILSLGHILLQGFYGTTVSTSRLIFWLPHSKSTLYLRLIQKSLSDVREPKYTSSYLLFAAGVVYLVFVSVIQTPSQQPLVFFLFLHIPTTIALAATFDALKSSSSCLGSFGLFHNIVCSSLCRRPPRKHQGSAQNAISSDCKRLLRARV